MSVRPQEDPVPPSVIPGMHASRRPLPAALVQALRPRQATKNLFVYAALVFSGKLFDPALFGRATLAFLLFAAASGSIYLLNDILDAEQDRQHPEKRHRPVASGDLPVPVAWMSALLLAAGSLFAGFLLHLKFGLVLLAYVLLQLGYNFYLKHQVLLDVFAIAGGFVLRTVAGGAVDDIYISRWLLLCSLLLALLLGFGKRRQELALLGMGADQHRRILRAYSLPFLDQIINIVSGVTIVCYSVYCVESASAIRHPHLWVTIPIVIYSVCRYLYLVHQKGMGGAPDEVLLQDRALQVAILLWFCLILFLFAFDNPGIQFWGERP